MEVEISEFDTRADIIGQDSDGKIVLLAKVKADYAEYKRVQELISTWQALNIFIPFAMFVDLDKIWIYQRQDNSFPKEPIKSFKTADVLCHYEAEFSQKRIFKPYMVRLVESWLRDLAYNWKSETPPGSEQLAAVGLLECLKGGTTQSDVDIGYLIGKVNYSEKITREYSLSNRQDRYSFKYAKKVRLVRKDSTRLIVKQKNISKQMQEDLVDLEKEYRSELQKIHNPRQRRKLKSQYNKLKLYLLDQVLNE